MQVSKNPRAKGSVERTHSTSASFARPGSWRYEVYMGLRVSARVAVKLGIDVEFSWGVAVVL